MKETKQHGFTLIELMIVVSIIGILSAIALTQYQDYISRTQLNTVVSELSGYKAGIENHLNEGATDFSLQDLGYLESNFTSTAIISDAIGAAGALPVTTNFSDVGVGVLAAQLSNVGQKQSVASLSGTIVYLIRASDGSWSCNIDESIPLAAGTWKNSYLPAGCN